MFSPPTHLHILHHFLFEAAITFVNGVRDGTVRTRSYDYEIYRSFNVNVVVLKGAVTKYLRLQIFGIHFTLCWFVRQLKTDPAGEIKKKKKRFQCWNILTTHPNTKVLYNVQGEKLTMSPQACHT